LNRRCEVLERFTDGARVCVVLGQEEAYAAEADAVGTEHLLLGLLDQGDELVAEALKGAGFPERATQVSKTCPPSVRTVHIPFTPGAANALRRSQDEAAALGEAQVRPGHLLLALLPSDASLPFADGATKSLQQQGVDLVRLRNRVIGLLKSPTLGKPKTRRELIRESDPLGDPSSAMRIYYGSQVISDPLPTPPPAITVDRDEALAIARREQNFGSAAQPGTPAATLRMVTVGLPDEEPTPHPAWILTWKNSTPQLHGPPSLSAERRAEIIGNTACVFIVVIDASTGSAKYAGQLCRRRGAKA
jgi:hypothetical protein